MKKKPKNEILYNIEKYNNFKALDDDEDSNKNKNEAAKNDEKPPKDEKVDFDNYREKLGDFLENFREGNEEEPKYFKAMKNMISKGWNIFHLSLLDVGKYNPNLKSFLSENSSTLERCKELREWLITYDANFEGTFKSDLLPSSASAQLQLNFNFNLVGS